MSSASNRNDVSGDGAELCGQSAAAGILVIGALAVLVGAMAVWITRRRPTHGR